MNKRKIFAAQVSRRSFLSSIGAAGVVATAGPAIAHAQTAPPMTSSDASPTETVEGAVPVSLRVNGKQLDLQLDPRTTLLDCLRETSLTGTKKGCDHGQCGACTVHSTAAASTLPVARCHVRRLEITTIEGLGQPGNCIPSGFVPGVRWLPVRLLHLGQIMSAAAL